MQSTQKNVIALAKLQELHSQQRRLAQVKRFFPLSPDGGSHSLALFIARYCAQVFQRNANLQPGENELSRLSINFGKAGAEDLVALNNGMDGSIQGVIVQITAQAQRFRHVVFDTCPLQLMDDP